MFRSVAQVSMYSAEELSLADTRRLLEYRRERAFGVSFDLKGFDYPWIVRARRWREGERVLDVGSGYSPLPSYLAKTYGCEVRAVDDFGTTSDEPFWERGRDPRERISAHPEVRCVLERLGDPDTSTLPAGYFDCVYSASTLEHVPNSMLSAVWRHMDLLLRPGGEMLHAVDLIVPSDRGLRHLLLTQVFDLGFPFLPRSLRYRFARKTPRAYVRCMFDSLRVPAPRIPRGLEVVRMVLDLEVLNESLDWTYNRMVRDGMTGIRHIKTASLQIHLRKQSEKGGRP